MDLWGVNGGDPCAVHRGTQILQGFTYTWGCTGASGVGAQKVAPAHLHLFLLDKACSCRPSLAWSQTIQGS